MTVWAVIPARFASTRFPGKPLAAETGKPLIQHVWERVRLGQSIDHVTVATDDERIAAAVRAFGGQAMLTRADHRTGTDRVAEVARSLAGDPDDSFAGDDLVLNVQGDEPDLNAAVLDRLIARMKADPATLIGTLACRFRDDGPRSGPGSPADPHCVKVVVDGGGRALYFSRSLVPHPRDTSGAVDRPSRWLLHVGVYAFRANALLAITDPVRCPPGELEATESLEQLRWLQAGWPIAVVEVPPQPPGIDTPEDYAAFVRRRGLCAP